MTASSTIDDRLKKLELELGLCSNNVDKNGVDEQAMDVSLRVNHLLESTNLLLQQHSKPLPSSSGNFHTKNNNSSAPSKSLEDALLHCENLARSMDASCNGLLLAVTSSSNDSYTTAPLIYRKQEVLARCEELEVALDQLASIRDLVSISNPNLIQNLQQCGKNSDVSLDHVDNAPILVSPSFTFAVEDVNKERLKDITTRVTNISDRMDELTKKCDDLISLYYRLISAVNEKLSLFQESQAFSKDK